MSNVEKFSGTTNLPTDPEQVIEGLQDFEFDRIVVVGFTRDGMEYFNSSEADAEPVLYDLARAQHKLQVMIDRMIAGEE